MAAVVPPGYVVSSGSMVLCSSGTFREGWLMFSDPRATTCTACGDNILSEPRDLDENPLAANGSLVPASSASCCEYTACNSYPCCWVLLRQKALSVLTQTRLVEGALLLLKRQGLSCGAAVCGVNIAPKQSLSAFPFLSCAAAVHETSCESHGMCAQTAT